MVNVSDNRSSLVFRVLDIDYKGISALDWGKKVCLWLCALWLCGFVALWLCGFVALFFVALFFVTFDVYSSPSTSV